MYPVSRALYRGDEKLVAPDGGLAFVVSGVVGEEVEVTLLEPTQTIVILVVTVPSPGCVTVVCSATG